MTKISRCIPYLVIPIMLIYFLVSSFGFNVIIDLFTE